MEILSNLKEMVSQTAIDAVKKSGEVMESVKINFAIADKEAEISKLMREIGKTVYESSKSAAEVSQEDIAEKCAAIDNHFADIAILKARNIDLKNVKICKSCNYEASKANNFCPRCGSALTDE